MVLGYKFVLNFEIKEIINKVLEELNISENNFEKEIIEIKFLKDNIRKAFVFSERFKFKAIEDDKIIFQVFLPTGSYASILVRSLYL